MIPGPLPQACIDAMHRAADEMKDIKTFRGYGLSRVMIF
jgi:LL-diaminopimelate aminotransferase